MKLAFVCTESLPAPAIKGGAIQMMIDGVSPYLKKVFELTIYSISDPQLPNYELCNGIEYIRFPLPSYTKSVANDLAKKHYEIIHVFNRPKNILTYKKAAPYSHFVLGLHNDMLSSAKISTSLGKQIVTKVDQIVTISDYIRKIVVKRFPEAISKTKVVYSGVNLKEFPAIWSNTGKTIRTIYRERFNVQGKQVIFFSGRLSKNKGPHLLIKAMKKIVKKHKNAILIIAGGKWFSDDEPNEYIYYLRRLAKPISNKILFTNFIPADEIANLFLLSDVFVCSSQWQEPLARVHYEAMAAGIPVISTARGGNSEVITHLYNGYLIKKYSSVNAYVDAISFFLNNKQISTWIARNGRAFVETNFQFHHVAARLEAVYTDLITN